ncbi:MAG: hypothetical protein Q8J89_00040 [Caulobacter sp.]|nr:hypothetical protein [Caulobacter sp.]
MNVDVSREREPFRRLATAFWLALGVGAVTAFGFGVHDIYARRQTSDHPVPSADGQSIRSVRAAEDVVDLTVFQIIVGAAGIYFVAGTLRSSREAVREAGAATAAAREAVSVSRQAAYVQARPYFHSDQIESHAAIIEGVAHVQVRAIWENRGQTPARKAICLSNWCIVPKDIVPVDFDWPDPVDPQPASTVGPGCKLQSALHIPVVEVRRAISGECDILFWSRIEYGDGFDPSARWHSEASRRFVFGTRGLEDGNQQVDILFETIGPNGVDEECLRAV